MKGQEYFWLCFSDCDQGEEVILHLKHVFIRLLLLCTQEAKLLHWILAVF